MLTLERERQIWEMLSPPNSPVLKILDSAAIKIKTLQQHTDPSFPEPASDAAPLLSLYSLCL